MINAQGGVNGRNIRLISLDDAYNPAKTVEHTRTLVEREQVLALFASLGGATNGAIHKYVNDKGVPHLFISTNLMRWADPQHFPWTIQSIRAPFYLEGKIYGQHIARVRPNAKIALLYFLEDTAKDYVAGFKEGLGERAQSMIVAQATHDFADPTVDSQIISLKASGADTLLTLAGPKHASMAIRKVYDMGWRPLHIVPFFASSIGEVLNPPGWKSPLDSSPRRWPKIPPTRNGATIKR
jgi:ABC-type branched-subunit amino acid transport system substrate-binding protein